MISLNIMRSLAILLITNSHLREMHKLHFLATGGMLGNCVFFFISGFGTTFALTGRSREPFAAWYRRRLVRVYEPLIIVTLIFVLFGFLEVHSVADALDLFIAPSSYWFIPTIALFYIPLYFVALYASRTQIFSVIGLSIAVYIGLYEWIVDMHRWDVEDHVAVKGVFYFMVMLLGVYACKFHRNDTASGNGLVALLCVTLVYYGFLALLQKSQVFQLQFLTECIALVWTLCLYRCLRHEPTVRWLDRRLHAPVMLLSQITLQMYLLQEFWYSRKTFNEIFYPLNILCFFAVLIVSAWALSKVSVTSLAPHYRRLLAVPHGRLK